MHSADKSDRRHFDLFAALDLEILAPSPFEDPEAPVVLTCTLRKWYPRPACGTAVKSARISISVWNVECYMWFLEVLCAVVQSFV